MQPKHSFLTIAEESEGIYKEKGSKFISYAFPVSSAQDIKKHLERIRKNHFDARHHCFAWVLGPERKNFRAFDDGEPNHSAGDPILGQIRSRDLTNILVVVVRYFGGTKLGVSGLIDAYKTSAADALSHATIVERDVFFGVVLKSDYRFTAEVMKLVKEFDATINEQQFTDNDSIISVQIPARNREDFFQKVELLNVMGTRIEITLRED